MARPKSTAPPVYKLHKPSGQARVRVDGRELYLGVHGSPESVAAYQKLVNEWLKNGKRLPANLGALLAREPEPVVPASITVVELVDRYREWSAKEYGDTRVGEHRNTMDAIGPVVRLFGRLAAEPAACVTANSPNVVRLRQSDRSHIGRATAGGRCRERQRGGQEAR
jgi:hypothetical protein